MSLERRALLALLFFQTAVAGVGVLIESAGSCAACFTKGPSPALAGLAFYAVLLITFGVRKFERLRLAGIQIAFGIHCALTAKLFVSGETCALCIIAAAGSLALVITTLKIQPDNLGQVALLVPFSALLVAAGLGTVTPGGPSPAGSAAGVGILVFSEADCSYCDELRTQILPEIEREFGARIHVAWRSAAELPALRRTPTLILSSTRPGAKDRVIEGLPSLERLRGAIRDLESGS